MKDETMIAAVALGAIAIFALKKPISDLVTPTASILTSGADLVQKTEKGAESIIDSTVGYYKDLSQLPANLNQLINDTSKATKAYLKPTIVEVQKPVSFSSSNTVFTNPKNFAQKTANLSSAQKMIEIAKDPKVQNIATNVGNTVKIQPKTVQLVPKQNFGGLLI